MSARFRDGLLFGALLLLVGWPVAVLCEAAWHDDAGEPGLTVLYDRAPLVSNTLLLVAMTLLAAVPIGTAAGLVVFRCNLPGRIQFGVLLGIALLVPVDLQVSAWMAALGPGGLAGSLGIPFGLRGLAGAAWVHVAVAVPWVFVLAGAATRATEPDLEEDCLLTCGRLATVWHVTLRRSAGSLVAAALLVAVLTGGEMAVTDLLGVRTYAETVYTEFALAGRVSAATATAIPGLVGLLGMVGVACVLVSHRIPADWQALSAPRPVFPLGRWRRVAWSGTLLAVTMTLGVPALSLFWRAGLQFDGAPSWSVTALAKSLLRSTQAVGEELLYSLALAAVVAVLVVALALWCACAARDSGLGRALALSLTIVLLALPGPVLGAAVSLALGRPTAWWGSAMTGSDTLAARFADQLAAIADSPAVLVWVMSLRALPFAMLVIWPAVRLIDRSRMEAAQMDGAGWWQQFRHIILPGCWPAAAAAALASAVLSIGELGGTVIVAPPGLQPISVRIFTLAHSGVENYLAGICLLLLIVIASGALATSYCLRWALRCLDPPWPANMTRGLPQ